MSTAPAHETRLSIKCCVQGTEKEREKGTGSERGKRECACGWPDRGCVRIQTCDTVPPAAKDNE